MMIETLYGQLIDLTFNVLRGTSAPNLVRAEEAGDLMTNVERAVGAPTDDRLIFVEAKNLAEALVQIEAARRFREPVRERVYCQIAGVLLPVVREQAAACIARRRSVPTTDHDYRRPER